MRSIRRRKPGAVAAAGPGCPPFGVHDGVEPSAGPAGRSIRAAGIARSQGGRASGGVVRPGRARPRHGTQTMVWRTKTFSKARRSRLPKDSASTMPGGTAARRALRAAACRVSARERSRRWDAAWGHRIAVETITLPVSPGRPGGRKFGRLVHDMLQHTSRGRGLGNVGGHLGTASRRRPIWNALPRRRWWQPRWRIPRWLYPPEPGVIANSR